MQRIVNWIYFTSLLNDTARDKTHTGCTITDFWLGFTRAVPVLSGRFQVFVALTLMYRFTGVTFERQRSWSKVSRGDHNAAGEPHSAPARHWWGSHKITSIKFRFRKQIFHLINIIQDMRPASYSCGGKYLKLFFVKFLGFGAVLICWSMPTFRIPGEPVAVSFHFFSLICFNLFKVFLYYTRIHLSQS
jgi:hypothetical protein